jgi:hypothetical protein
MTCRTIGLLLGIPLFLCIPTLAADYVVQVGPPNGSDDTVQIQTALDDCMNNHPTGCTVQLSSGTYLTQQLFGEDFHGSLRGMGMDATRIQVKRFDEVTGDHIGYYIFDIYPPSRTNKYPILLIFMAGDITVSDMSFVVTDYEPVPQWCYYDECGQTWLYGVVGVIGTSANLLVERVGFEGGPGTMVASRHNYNDGPFFWGLSVDQPLTGTFKVVSSRIGNSEDSMTAIALSNAKVTIGGSPSHGNVIEGGSQGAGFLDMAHSVVDFSYNDVEVSAYPWAGVLAGQGYAWIPQESSQFLIRHNTIKATGSWVDGIWAADFGPPSGLGKSADFVISDNTIQVAGSEVDPAWAGVEAAYLDDAVISNNRIMGTNAFLGIALEGASECIVKANNVEKMNADLAPIGLLTANVGTEEEPILVPTSGSTVVGFGKKTNVYDEGVNNTIVGVNNMQGNPPGPAIRDAMKRKMEMIKSMRKF